MELIASETGILVVTTSIVVSAMRYTRLEETQAVNGVGSTSSQRH
jgi:hypothetical protein